jgi:hypothetical protein
VIRCSISKRRVTAPSSSGEDTRCLLSGVEQLAVAVTRDEPHGLASIRPKFF